MLYKLTVSLLTSLICAAVMVLPCDGAGAPKNIRKYDGHWWLSATQAAQSGFLNGYYDCYRYEYKGSAQFTSNPPEIARSHVTKFYKQNVSRLANPVASVFYGLRDQPGEKPSASGGQPIRGRHGYYRGLYWMEISLSKGAQLGFVEGYLACHAQLNHNNGGTFSKPPSEYVALINHWYRFNPATGDIDGNRQPTAIADVLFKFRDRSQHPRPGNQ